MRYGLHTHTRPVKVERSAIFPTTCCCCCCLVRFFFFLEPGLEGVASVLYRAGFSRFFDRFSFVLWWGESRRFIFFSLSLCTLLLLLRIFLAITCARASGYMRFYSGVNGYLGKLRVFDSGFNGCWVWERINTRKGSWSAVYIEIW